MANKKLDRFVIDDESLKFILDWLSKNSMARADIDKCHAVYKKFEIEFNTNEVVRDNGEILPSIQDKSAKMLLRCVVLPESDQLDNCIKFRLRVWDSKGKLYDDHNFSLRYRVMRTIEDAENELDFLKNLENSKGNFQADKDIAQASIKTLEDIILGFEKNVVMYCLINDKLTKAEAKKKIESITFPRVSLCIGTSSNNYKDEKRSKRIEAAADICFALYDAVTLFLAYFKPEVMEYRGETKSVTDTKSKPQAKKKKKKKKEEEKVSLIHITKYINDIRSGGVKLPRRKCLYAYQVRGHFRHYKSGKTVWISEFTKNEKGKKQGRIIKVDTPKKDKK